jgi:hypothetical protein
VLNLDRIAKFGSVELVDQIDTAFDIFISLSVTVFAILGPFLVISSLLRKKPAAA